jgi:hypothetical protein
MNPAATTRRLLRLYPRAWRARYGDELEALILESSGGRPVPWRTRVDVALAAGREHLHELRARGGRSPHERARAGALRTLWGWMLFVCAGVAVQKLSEHWQDSVPTGSRALPAAAFSGLVAGAAVGSALVLAGFVVLIPSLCAFVRSGGLSGIRRSLARSRLATLLTAAAGLAVGVWAHRLTSYQRNGHDPAYGAAFVACGLLAALCLASWVATASAVARRLELSSGVLRLEAAAATALAVAMAAMTASTVVWWRAAASAAPATLAGGSRGDHSSSGLPGLLAVAVVLMLVATTLGATGARGALSASAGLPRGPDDGVGAS